MITIALILCDLVALGILVFVAYRPRHRRDDMVVPFLGVNVGVLAVSTALASTEVAAGLGLGLFGVLSIIRLRSRELEHIEIAYYFAALALGLLGGIATSPVWLTPVLMVAIVGVVGVGDRVTSNAGQQRQQIILDTAITDPEALEERCAALLDAEVHTVTVERLDLVRDSTTVVVRYVPRAAEARPAAHVEASGGAANLPVTAGRP